MLLEDAKKETDGDFEVICRLQSSKKLILIYGCENHAESVYKYLHAHGLKVEAYIVDSQYWKEDFFIGTIQVKKLDDYRDLLDEYNIVIGFCDVEKSRFLMNNTQLRKGNYYFLWEPLVTYEWSTEYLQENWNALCDVYGNLADEVSKKILHELIWAKLNVSGERILRLADNRQYFNALTFIHDSSKEVFVDCGAFDGDTIMKYVAFTGGIYKKFLLLNQMKKMEVHLKLLMRAGGLRLMFDFVCKNNCNELSDTSQNQIRMQSFFILSPISR